MVTGRQQAFYRALRRTAAVLNTNITLDEFLDIIIRGTARAMEASASLLLLDSTRQKLVHHTSWRVPKAYLQKGALDAHQSLAEVITGQPVAISDASHDGHVQYPEFAAQFGIASVLGVPLVVNNTIVGSIRVYTRQPTEFTPQDISFVAAMADLAAVAINRSKPPQTQPDKPPDCIPEAPVIPLQRVSFVHPSEEEFAHILDFYHIEWLYEPRSFPLQWQEGRVTEMFAPDFYLPALDLYVELTTLRQGLVTFKNRKLRRLRELYPDIKITLLYKKDFDRLLAKYGCGPLAQARGRGVRRVLYSSAELQRRTHELAGQISSDYAEQRPVLVGVLRGVFCFLADLIREVTIPVEIEFMAISYYGGNQSPGVKITKDLDVNVSGRHIIMVEDIVDTGMTLNYLLGHLRAKGPASITVCTLLDKRIRRIVDVPIKYVGFEVQDEFVVGYGLDYNGEYRNLPFIGVLGTEGAASTGDPTQQSVLKTVPPR